MDRISYEVTKKFLAEAEEQISLKIPSMRGYYNKQLSLYHEELCNGKEETSKKVTDETKYLEKFCPNCGVEFGTGTVKLKLKSKYKKCHTAGTQINIPKKRKKLILKGCQHRTLTINCLNCNSQISREGTSKFHRDKAVLTEMPFLKNLNTPITGKLKNLRQATMCTPKQSLLETTLLNRSNANTPDGISSSSKRRRNRGKSFSPLLALGKEKKTPEKPSLLSFLSSI